jgi:predicted NBD/HSP70 family sugar kinase
MELYGLNIPPFRAPELDEGFLPFAKFERAYVSGAKKPVAIVLERPRNQLAVHTTRIYGTENMRLADAFFTERLVKTLLWMKGGFRITVYGDNAVYETIKAAYTEFGARAFDKGFMERVYERSFEVLFGGGYENRPCPSEHSEPLGGHLDGCRIGFDAGGSDRKVSAVVNGETVFSEEVVWHPKTQSDPKYHYNGIVSAFRAAASHMPRVDSIGVSSAGVYVDNRAMVASLFLKVPDELFDAQVKDIYIRAAKEFGDVPLTVCNDGDVTALAGSMGLHSNAVLGIAMGTSEAAGFIDVKGNVTGWLNELAFAPVDMQQNAPEDEWSKDFGCGVKYFSQDAVYRLAPLAGIPLDMSLSPAEQLKAVQTLMEAGDKRAACVFRTIGTYLGHTLAHYYDLYGCSYALLLGRVMSGKGGELILNEAQTTLRSDYKEIAEKLQVSLPDERTRRVGQSVAAASLPEIKKV